MEASSPSDKEFSENCRTTMLIFPFVFLKGGLFLLLPTIKFTANELQQSRAS